MSYPRIAVVSLSQGRFLPAISRYRVPRRSNRLMLEALEDRQLLATFIVTDLASSGPGSLRAAIVAADVRPGPDTIDFAVTGTIRVAGASLPALTDVVTIDGTSAPGFAGTPKVTIDFGGKLGLVFAPGSDRLDSQIALAGPGAERGRHARRLVHHGPGQLYRHPARRSDRRQRRGRRPDQGFLARQPDWPFGPGLEHPVLRCQPRARPAGDGLAGHPRWRPPRAVHPHRNFGQPRAPLRRADLRRRRPELRGERPRGDHDQRLRARTRSATACSGSSAATRTAALSTASCSRVRSPTSDRLPATRRSTTPAQVTPTSTAPWAASPWATPTAPKAPAPIGTGPRVPLRHRQGHLPPTSSTPARPAPRPTASGTTATAIHDRRRLQCRPGEQGNGLELHAYLVDYDAANQTSSPTGPRSTIPTA